MDTELSEAGERFGRAMCLEESKQGLPSDSLTHEEQICVRTVGINWQGALQRRFGFGSVKEAG